MPAHEHDCGNAGGEDVDKLPSSDRSNEPQPKKGDVNGGQQLPPTLMNVRANMLVATAVRGSMSNWNITGTVIREALPVTTLMALVEKKAGDH